MKKAGGFFWVVLLCCISCISITEVSFAQEAIEIGKLLSGDDDISIRDMSRIKNKIVISDTLRGWTYDWGGALNGSQASYRNWSGGGVNTISVTTSTVFNLQYRRNAFGYALATNLKYGRAQLDGEDTRKTDDRIAINNKFSYLFDDSEWSAFANVNLSTQFDKGFDYNVPDDVDPILISKFFSPAYFTQIAGISYKPVETFSAEAGLALKETIVADTMLSTRYGLDPGETFRFEPGYSVALNFQQVIANNVRIVSSLETFTNLQRSIRSTDVQFTNEIVGKINNNLNTIFQFVLIYDDDFSRRVQIKQVLSVGFSFSIL